MHAALGVVLDRARQLAVFGDDDALGVDGGDDASLIGNDHNLGVAGNALFDAGADERRLGLEKRHALALHVRTHERAIGVVVLKERNHAGGNGDDLLGRNVHEVDLAGGHLDEVAVLAGGHLADEVALVIDLGVGLGDDLALFLVGGEVLDLVGDATVLDRAVRCFDEPEFIDAGVGREGVDEADVRTFRRLDGADAAVV